MKDFVPSSILPRSKNPLVSYIVTQFGRSQASRIFVPSLPVVWVTAGRVPVSKHSKIVLIKADFPDPAIPNSTIFKRKPSISPSRASSNRSYAPTLYSINLSTSCSISLAGGSIGAMIVFLGIRWLFLSSTAFLCLLKRGIICYSDAFTKRKASIHSDHWMHNTLTSRKVFLEILFLHLSLRTYGVQNALRPIAQK